MAYYIDIDFGSGFVPASQVILDDTQLAREKEGLKIRHTVPGAISFYNLDYDLLLSKKNSGSVQLPCRIRWKNVPIFIGTIMLFGIYRENSKVCTLEFEKDDKYTKLLQGMDTELTLDFDTTVYMEVVTSHRLKVQMRAGKDASGDCNNPVDVPEWAYMGYGFPNQPKAYDNDYCYIASQRYDAGNCIAFVGEYDDSFVRVPDGRAFACIADCRGVKPIQTPGWEGHWVQVARSWNWIMGQEYASVQWTEGTWYEKDRVWGKGATSGGATYLEPIRVLTVFDMLKALLAEVDPTITIDEATWFTALPIIKPNILDLVLHKFYIEPNLTGCDKEEYNITRTIEEVIEMMMFSFNLDWYLDGQEFVFKHPSEVVRVHPPPFNQGVPGSWNWINKIYAEDWSSETFTDDLDNKILKEEWSIRGSENPTFLPQTIRYINPYVNTFKRSGSGFALDYQAILQDQDDKTVILLAVTAKTPIGIVQTPVSLQSGLPVYNGALSLWSLVIGFWKWDRPYAIGYLTDPDRKGDTRIALIRRRDRTTEITVPYYDPDLVDFQKYLETSNGALVIQKITVNLANATAVINAAKE